MAKARKGMDVFPWGPSLLEQAADLPPISTGYMR
jgi:hypothetical protein